MLQNCRTCQSDNLEPLLNLGNHPFADTFIRQDDSNYRENYVPLGITICGSCKAVQTTYPTDNVERYQGYEYSYDSMNSPISIAHFDDLADSISCFIGGFSNKTRVLEFGSNIGTFILKLKSMGVEDVLGVDPAKNIAEIAKNKFQVETLVEFFGTNLLDKGLGKFDVISGSNVVNHANDVLDVFVAANHLLKNDGKFIFEVPYLLDLVEGRAFDTIYHEHVFYHSITSLKFALNKAGLTIVNIERRPYMCGTIRVFCQKGSADSTLVDEFLELENKAKIHVANTYVSFFNDVKMMKYYTLNELTKIKMKGEKICGIGAATKGNTLLNFFGVDSTFIDCISDASLHKQNKLTPGSRIPIVSDEFVKNQNYTHALILLGILNSISKKNLKILVLNW